MKKKIRKQIFTPETKINEIHVQISKTDWPKSGWPIRKKTITESRKKENKYDKFKFLMLFDVIIFANINT